MKTDKKPLILIVDDTPQNIQVLGNILYDKGYSVSMATSGMEALQSLKNKIPDLILLDIQMPEMDGYEVCTLIKSNEETKHIPVIFLTAVTETSFMIRGFKCGAVDYITKPFKSAELTARVATHIDLKKAKEKLELEKKKVETLNIKLQSTNNNLNIAYKEIKDSIHYSKRIQENLLPDLSFLTGNGLKHILIYKPKDIISGDFYWVEQIKDKIFIAIADCTGHGIPGALLSMLGHNLLNEIVKIEGIYDSSEILNNLNKRFRNLLKQEITLSHDGMDIALCVIHSKTKIMEYVGAKRPICYFNNKHIVELLPDKFSIGGLENNNSVFNKQIIKLKRGNKIFMYTDGITDQFDNNNMKKITRKRFKYQLALFVKHPLNTIKKDLLNYLKEWKGCSSQTDDILVFGFEIS